MKNKPTIICITTIFTASLLLMGACAGEPEAADIREDAEALTNQQMMAGNPNTAHMISTTSTTLSDIDLSIAQTFSITRPTETLTTTYATYFITGTSDPDQPVYFDDDEIERLGTLGTFGVHVELENGENTFTFRQGDRTETVTIIRGQSGSGTISEIQQWTMFPTSYGGVKVGEELQLACTAPAGAAVTASFGGKTVTLQQSAQASNGIPAVYRGAVRVDGDYPADETTNAGKVTYTLQYNGNTTQYQSSGDVYVAGADSELAVSVSTYMGVVYNSTSNGGSFKEKLRRGSTDYITGMSTQYYSLASGGYLPVDSGRILEGNVQVDNQLSGVSAANHTKYETYTFSGTVTPVFYTRQTRGKLSLTLYNTRGTPDVDMSSSRIFSSASAADNGDNSVTYQFNMKSDSAILWGYSVTYDGDDTVLRIAYRPQAGSGAQPLSGIVIMLDPGHGDTDSGAFGVAGKLGPDEATVNLAHALATKERLEAMGATIYLTRENTFPSLDDRVEMFEATGADLFVSLHHNSLMESTDANNVTGMEMYYHTPQSSGMAKKLLNHVSSSINRKNRGADQSYYRVTMSGAAPSMLFELGYLTNPAEYERICNPGNIEQTADAIAEGIYMAFS